MNGVLTGSTLVRKSFADVTRRKGRTLIVVLSICIGVFGLTGINTFEFKIFDVFAHMQDHSRYPDIMFQVNHVDPALTQQLAALPDVQILQTQMQGSFQWHTATSSIPITITAFQNPQWVELAGYELTSGHNAVSREIVMETIDSALHPFALNDTIQIDTSHGPVSLRVVGTASTAGLTQPKASHVAQAYMSLEGLASVLGSSQLNSIAVKVRNIDTVQNTVASITKIVQARHIVMSNVKVQSSVAQRMGASVVVAIFNIIRLLASGALLVSCFLIINTLTTLISEQVKIIGTMKALGGTRDIIFKSYFLTVLIYSMLGTLLGLGLGIAAGYETAIQFARLKAWDLGPFSLEPSIFLIGSAVGIGVPLLAALLPLLDGTRISVRAALSGYGIGGGDSLRLRSWQRLIAERMAGMPQTVWLGLRGTFRKRSRAIGTIAALSVAGTAFLAILSVVYSIDQVLIHSYADFDCNVVMDVKPQAFAPLRQRVAAVAGVQQVERVITTGVTTQWGQLGLFGLDASTRLYHKQLSGGRWFAPSERNVALLSDDLVRLTGLTIGKPLTFTDDTGHATTWTIIGTVSATENSIFSSGVVITSADNVNLLRGDPEDSANQLYIQASNQNPLAIQQLVNLLNATMQAQEAAPAQSVQQAIAASESSAFGLFLLFYVTAIGVGLAGVLGLYNTLMSSVLERQREIGIWRSMGASNGQVALVFWIESFALAVLGWLFGAIVGIPAAYGFVSLVAQWLFRIPFAFNAWLLGEMLLAMLIVATLASIIPAARASSVRIAEILRYE